MHPHHITLAPRTGRWGEERQMIRTDAIHTFPDRTAAPRLPWTWMACLLLVAACACGGSTQSHYVPPAAPAISEFQVAPDPLTAGTAGTPVAATNVLAPVSGLIVYKLF